MSKISVKISKARNRARNRNTPPEILAQLTKDKYYHMRKALAKNPSTPPFIRLFL
jgi:hypothetical protein